MGGGVDLVLNAKSLERGEAGAATGLVLVRRFVAGRRLAATGGLAVAAGVGKSFAKLSSPSRGPCG
jgi:hypothetical protein